MNYLLRLYYTLRPLKGRQWWYRLVQPVMKKCSRLCRVSAEDISAALAQVKVPLISLPAYRHYEPAKKEFCFLNLRAEFPQDIDWNYSAYGLLWAYNLNYFEWLYDDRLSVQERLRTIQSYPDTKEGGYIGLQSYPASLRIVAWTRFLLRYDLKDRRMLSSLYQQADWVCRFPEYHLDGNHLWENGVALLHAAAFFQNHRFYGKGKALLIACLEEQLFNDGGHTEGSPMYHSLLLWRVMQCIETIRALPVENDDLLLRLETTAEKMGGWLLAVTFSDGTWPLINDSTNGIAPTTKELLQYAQHLGLNISRQCLQDSQYRMISAGPMELFVDAADIHPAYQPGHAHADVGTFCLHIEGKPVIVDTGISTYTAGTLRGQQRSTTAHNTLCLNGRNSSDVWKSFRVGRRSVVEKLWVHDHELVLSHDYLDTVHERSFSWDNDALLITDSFKSRSACNAIVNLHFHPDVIIKQINECTYIAGGVQIHFNAFVYTEIINYECATGFNELKESTCITVTVRDSQLITSITIV